MKKNKVTQIIAAFALFWIIIWIVWTWLLVLFSNNQPYNSEVTLTPEQIQELIKSQSGAIAGTGITIETNSWTNIWTWENQ